jgi:Uma2 family endonuclease
LGEPPQESAAPSHHDVIVRNIAQALTQALRATRYRVTSPARVQDTCMQLHLSDVCVALDVCESAPENIEVDPRAIVEVLSPSTENDDRGKKFENFQAIPALCEFLLICQDRPRVEHYTRQEGADEWTLKAVTSFDAAIHFPSLDCDIPLTEIYAKVEFAAGPLGLHGDQEGEA